MRVSKLWGAALVCAACSRRESPPLPGDAGQATAPSLSPGGPVEDQGDTRAERQRFRNQLEIARLEKQYGALPRHALTAQEPRCVVACTDGSRVRGVLLVGTTGDVPEGCLPPKLRGDAGVDTLSAWCNQHLPACAGRCRVTPAPAPAAPVSSAARPCKCQSANPLCSCL
ncbi:MAG: hypothetical protein IPI67_05660 [Myxococcales bacterium]|nr:hypothetical protein [Myxococcales bacterium]